MKILLTHIIKMYSMIISRKNYTVLVLLTSEETPRLYIKSMNITNSGILKQ